MWARDFEPLGLDQFHHGGSEGLRFLLRQIVARALDHTMNTAAGEFGSGCGAIGRRHDAVGVAVQRDGGYRDRRERRQAPL